MQEELPGGGVIGELESGAVEIKEKRQEGVRGRSLRPIRFDRIQKRTKVRPRCHCHHNRESEGI